MGKKNKKRRAVVYCCGGDRAKRKLESSLLEGDCNQALNESPEGILECAWGCIGLGTCVNVCRPKAIHINSHGVAEVDYKKCIGCKLCVNACPKGLIGMIPSENTIAPLCSNRDKGPVAKTVCEVSCIACRICEKNCPVDAITVLDNHAVLDEERCIACGMCAVKCPRGLIIDSNGFFSIA